MDNNYQFQPQQPVQPMPQYYGQPAPFMQGIPEEYRPIGAWGYFGYQLLFSIPLIGFIFLLIFALGGTRNINLRNYARSYFCAFLIFFIFFLIMFLIFGASMFAFTANGTSY